MGFELDFFPDLDRAGVERDILGVAGLWYCPQLLSADEQSSILREIDARPWLDDLRRRVQHYGYKYDYKARRVDRSMFVGALPDFATGVGQKMLDRNLIDEMPDQLIVNEYLPGQGITAHVDCRPCFKNVIATISLGSVYAMDLIDVATRKRVSLPLSVGGALVFRDEARHNWMHRIQARKTEKWGPRGRRVSLTFRNVILDDSTNEDI